LSSIECALFSLLKSGVVPCSKKNMVSGSTKSISLICPDRLLGWLLWEGAHERDVCGTERGSRLLPQWPPTRIFPPRRANAPITRRCGHAPSDIDPSATSPLKDTKPNEATSCRKTRHHEGKTKSALRESNLKPPPLSPKTTQRHDDERKNTSNCCNGNSSEKPNDPIQSRSDDESSFHGVFSSRCFDSTIAIGGPTKHVAAEVDVIITKASV